MNCADCGKTGVQALQVMNTMRRELPAKLSRKRRKPDREGLTSGPDVEVIILPAWACPIQTKNGIGFHMNVGVWISIVLGFWVSMIELSDDDEE